MKRPAILFWILLAGAHCSAIVAESKEDPNTDFVASANLANLTQMVQESYSGQISAGSKIQNTHVLLYLYDWPGVNANRVLTGLPNLRELLLSYDLHLGLLTVNRTQILKDAPEADPKIPDTLSEYFPNWRTEDEYQKTSRLVLCDRHAACTEYTGPPSFPSLIEWVRRAVRPPVRVLSDAASADADVQRAGEPMALVVRPGRDGILGSHDQAIAWLAGLAARFENITMMYDSRPDPDQNSAFPTITLYRDFDLGHIEFPRSNVPSEDVRKVTAETFGKSDIEVWLSRESNPVVILFDNTQHANKLFGQAGIKTLVLYTMHNATTKNTPEMKIFFETALKYCDTFNLVHARVGTESGNSLYQYMVRPYSNKTEVWIFEKKAEGIDRFPLVDKDAQFASSTEEPLPVIPELTTKTLTKFIEDWYQKKLQPELKSQAPPSDQELASAPKHLHFLVGKTLPLVVQKAESPLLVLFFSANCQYSAEFAPVFDEVALSLAKSGQLRFGVIEGGRNQVHGLEVEGFPVVFLFRRTPTTPAAGADQELAENRRIVPDLGEAIEFWGQRSRLSLLAFVKREVPSIDLETILGAGEAQKVQERIELEYEGGNEQYDMGFDEEELNRLLEEQLKEQQSSKDPTDNSERVETIVETDL